MTSTTRLGQPAWWVAAIGAGAAAMAMLLVLGIAVIVGGAGTGVRVPAFTSSGPSATALADIPADYLGLYRAAGARYGLDWAVLAAIGKVETDHGRSNLPGVHAGVNCAGAAGPMQFGIGAGDHGCGDAGNAWAVYGGDGDDDGDRDVYDAADAIPAAARYLRTSGAPDDYRRAIFALQPRRLVRRAGLRVGGALPRRSRRRLTRRGRTGPVRRDMARRGPGNHPAL